MWSRGRLGSLAPAPSHHPFTGPKNATSEGTTAEALGPLDVDAFGSRGPQPALDHAGSGDSRTSAWAAVDHHLVDSQRVSRKEHDGEGT